MIIKFGRNRILYLSTTKALLFFLAVSLLCFGYVAAKETYYRPVEKKAYEKLSLTTPTLLPTEVPTAAPTPIAQEIKKIVAKAPIKPKATAVPKASSTTTCNGTTVVTTAGTITCSEIPSLPTKTITNPLNLTIIDETGKNEALINPLKDYLSTKLKWSTEISSLSEIKIVDAGDTGWAGQYSFSYNQTASGNITSILGLIKLNVYYYRNSPYLTDYMKLVLSHEYGHHYTQYYKLLKWKLGNGTRFPDSYYATRPLPKGTTTYDYSLGWENCDAEIIAEDYSYIYSGYGNQGMASKYSYPSAALSTWLTTSLVQGSNSSIQAAATPQIVDNLPTITFVLPAENATVTSTITIRANANDDHAITKVGFYINDTLIINDASAPYETTLFTGTYDNGSNTIKAVAYDDSNQSASASMNLTFNNPKPAVTIRNPDSDPYTWSTGDLTVDISATSELGILKIEVYINNQLVGQQTGGRLLGSLPASAIPAGNYTLKTIAYDRNGNTSQKTITFTKQ